MQFGSKGIYFDIWKLYSHIVFFLNYSKGWKVKHEESKQKQKQKQKYSKYNISPIQ